MKATEVKCTDSTWTIDFAYQPMIPEGYHFNINNQPNFYPIDSLRWEVLECTTSTTDSVKSVATDNIHIILTLHDVTGNKCGGFKLKGMLLYGVCDNNWCVEMPLDSIMICVRPPKKHF